MIDRKVVLLFPFSLVCVRFYRGRQYCLLRSKHYDHTVLCFKLTGGGRPWRVSPAKINLAFRLKTAI